MFLGGINFSPLNENIVLPSGNTTLSVSISIMPDLTHRIDTRDFTVSIRGLGSTCVIVENSEVPVIITNNEGMCVCMCVCMYVCVYVCVCMCVCVCMYACMYVCMYDIICMYVCM